MATYQSNPLPAPPPGPQQTASYSQYQQQQYPTYPQPQQPQQQDARQSHSVAQRPRHKSRTLSFHSDKSQKNRVDLHETSAEKESHRLHSKADPTLAMNEAEPAAVQATVKSSLASLRELQHRDSYGNPISEPDRSNPTRNRWERPLDTIRSFEAAIDGGYNRKSFIRADSESVANWNRRSSYYGNPGGRFPNNSYYGGRPQSTMRQDSAQPGMHRRDSYYYDQQDSGDGYGPPPPAHGRQRYNRMTSEPQLNAYGRGGQNVYPTPNNHRSYETVTSAGGSGTSAEPAGYQTDPTSSDNSSFDRIQPPPQKAQPERPVNDYGIGFSQDNMYQPAAFGVGTNPPSAMAATPRTYQASPNGRYEAPPPVPQKDQGGLMRQPMAGNSSQVAPQRPNLGDKRKSWFSRRFSRQG